MRTRILSFIAPVAVAALGFGGALRNSADETAGKRLAPEWGYKHVSAPVNCQQVQICSNSGSFVCKSDIDGSTLYRLESTNPNQCPSILMRNTQ
ncbi:hypothetical protein ACLI09_01745 [Flavobacterium sp. RHBU_24]|uniref:hypothetical protein n=1 Tax=Flavobacterium sp. RHBU_24 TaxID=3391185 RepID=UPI00398506DB